MDRQIHNLVFEGGGVKGISYVGALQELEARGKLKDVQRVGGTSAGAITTLLVGLGLTPDQIKEEMTDLDFTYSLDSPLLPVEEMTSIAALKQLSWWRIPLMLLMLAKLYFKFGLVSGNNFRKWISELIEKKAGLNDPIFRELHNLEAAENFREMYFVGANISKNVCEVYSQEDTPNMSVIEAVRTCMSFPFVFTPVRRQSEISSR